MKSEEPSSFLQDQIQSQTKIQKQQNQFKALFFKNALLQSKQKGTNCCQILTPIICLVFTYLIKIVAQDGLKTNIQVEDNKYPYKFNDYYDYDQLNTITNNKTKQTALLRWQQLQYLVYQCGVGCNQTYLGKNNGIQGESNGMLGNVQIANKNVTFHYEPYTINISQTRNVPFFLKYGSVNGNLFSRLGVMGKQSFDYIKNGRGLDYLPDGAIKFNLLNSTFLNAEIKVNDCRDLQYHRVNGISENRQIKYIKNAFLNETQLYFNETQFTQAYGMLDIIHMMTAAYIQTVKGEAIRAGYLLMPAANQASFVQTLINSISALIYPLGLSLLFPVFLYTIVLQKQQRLVQMMKMNGLKIRYYWLTFFMFNLLLCTITNLLFYLLGSLVLNGTFFTKTSKVLLLLISLGWSLAQIGMAAFFQTFLNKSRSANIIGYLFSIWTTMIAATLNLGSYQFPTQLPVGLRIIPPFAFVRSYYLMMMSCSSADCFYDMGTISQELASCIVFLYVGFVVFFILGIYLFEIIPQEFGIRRSPLFPFQALSAICQKKQTVQINTSEDIQLRNYISEHEEDNFSKKERQKVVSFSKQQDQEEIKSKYPLIINNMRKLYKKEGVQGFYPAVRSFNLAIANKQTFGLLGPNGAGKTTLISMITGMYEPNHGNAWIGGYDIQTSIQKAQLQMGVCPQFDLVWPQLTVAQHLRFYARLKGIPQKLIKDQIQRSIQQVKLQKFSNFAAKQLSGGMRRRLSVAISLVGDPKIVFLDQPSTGLDPQNRRQLWAVLAQCQTKRALFITTHMMQQADTLCNRVGIITSGVLRTIQTPIKLKKYYGQGINVIINTLKEQRQLISQQSLNLGIQEEQWFDEGKKIRNSIGSFVENQLLKANQLNHINRKIVEFMKKQFQGTYLFKHFNGYLIFKVPSRFKISTLFETMNKVEKQLGFSDIAITNSSLEDVFMKVVQRFDSQQKIAYPYNRETGDNNNGSGQFLQQDPDRENNVNRSSQKFKSIPANKNSNRQSFQSFASRNRQSVISENGGKNQRQKRQPQKAHNDMDQKDQVNQSQSSDQYF